ncbi:MAG: Gfo/Idh/MocA family protein [Halanaerobiales bacterium]
MDKAKVGIVGCGDISGIYFKNCSKFKNLEVVACADLIEEKAQAKAEEFDIPEICTLEEMLKNPEIDIILNLTTPKSHASICLAALEAGKNVYVEKPLAVSKEDGQKIVDLAEEKGLLAGGAPDTFLGGGMQTCRKLIEDDWIGDVIGATAFMVCHGHESWHPDPEFYYEVGGGPMFDMGPYYLTALVSLIGPAKRVTGTTTKAFEERTITSEPKNGKVIPVEVPTHVSGIIEFANGAQASILTSFDVWGSKLPRIELYGTEGSLMVPDPNGFGGPVQIFKPETGEWKEVPLTHGFANNNRGLGVADMAYAIKNDRKHRASAKMANHVLEMMHGFHESSNQGKHIELKSSCDQPEPLPMGLPEDDLVK